jgi:hypothetical protein
MSPNDLEHLRKIERHLHHLLANAEKRTPGRWAFDPDNIGGGAWSYYGLVNADSGESVPVHVLVERPQNAPFIASCAGNAEAGWKATRAAIARILGCPRCGGTGITKGWMPTYNDPDNASMAPEAEPCCEGASDILAAWPDELLTC